MKLIIAEKPSLARNVGAAIGVIKAHNLGDGNGYLECKDGYYITWLIGHVLEPAEPEAYNSIFKNRGINHLPINPDTWILIEKKDTKKQLKIVKELIQKADLIINCGDPDREGQLLMDELFIYLNIKNKPIKRLLILDPKPSAIQAALLKMEDNSSYNSWYQAGLLRQQADWLIGMNFSRAFSSLNMVMTNQSESFPAGRVQTPTLMLAYHRDMAVENFKAVNFYNLFTTFNTADNEKFVAKLDLTSVESITLDNGYLVDDKTLKTIIEEIKTKNGSVISYEDKDSVTHPPLPFKLSTIQKEANRQLGISVAQITKAIQVLYEKQLITYPGTDCEYLPESFHQDAPNILNSLSNLFANEVKSADAAIKSKSFSDKDLDGNPHFGIIPTGELKGLSDTDSNSQAIYKIIAVQYIAQFYKTLNHNNVSVVVSVDKYNFKCSSKFITQLGWKALFKATDDVEESEENQKIPKLSVNQQVGVSDNQIKSSKTQKPKYYTEGTLIDAMVNIHANIENIVRLYETDEAKIKELVSQYKKVLKETSGLGTGRTRERILSALKSHEYLTVKGKNIITTDKGRRFANFLMDGEHLHTFSMVSSPLTTAIYEQYLDGVYKKTYSAQQFKTDLDNAIKEKIAFTKSLYNKFISSSNIEKCPKCDAGILIEKSGTYGKFKACNNYPDCDYIAKDKTDKPLSTTGNKCPQCSKDMVLRDGKFGKFECCRGYPECNYIAKKEKPPQASTGEKCPECGSDIIESDGKWGKWKRCNGYPKCKWTPHKDEKPKSEVSGEKCPKCGSDMLKRKSKDGKREFLGCSGFPKCNHMEW